MNKLIIILLFTLIYGGCFSQVKLESGFGLTYSAKEEYLVDNKIFSLNGITALNQMRLTRRNVSLVSNISILMKKTKGKITFTPSLASFDLELRYYLEKITFSISHRCIHPVSTFSKPIEFEIYGGYDLKFKILYNIK